MNFTVHSITPAPSPPYTISISRSEDLTTWGIFLSSILLSVGGLFSMIMASIKQSKCKTVNCLGLHCVRENMDV